MSQVKHFRLDIAHSHLVEWGALDVMGPEGWRLVRFASVRERDLIAKSENAGTSGKCFGFRLADFHRISLLALFRLVLYLMRCLEKNENDSV